MTMWGALPARFRRERVLLVGCGDVGLRVARSLGAGRRARLLALTSSPARINVLRAHGITALLGNLDAPATLRRLSGLATRVVHLAPPAAQGSTDERTRALLAALALRSAPRQLVYGSTTGVYGDCQGRWVRETDAIAPQTERAVRRADAEAQVRHWARVLGVRATVLRIPGIYAQDRAGGARERLLRGTPVLCAADDVYTNHIHADDLARAGCKALWWQTTQRVLNVCDDSQLKMGDYFDAMAARYGLPQPERITRADAPTRLSPLTLSFMSESRRLRNQRMKRELGLLLRYPQPV